MFEKDAKIMAWLLFGGPFLSGMIALFAPRTDFVCVAAMLIAVIGCYKILRSKLNQKRRTGVLIEWGMNTMTTDERKKYIFGYSMMTLSILIIVGQRVIEFQH
jgi:hypothetical protein